MGKLKVAIVSPYPPSKGTLNEYAYHLVQNFKAKEDIAEIFILTDEITEPYTEETQVGNCLVKIIPTWKFNSYTNAIKIVKAIKKNKVDIALFNIQFLSFGDKKIPGALGLIGPALTRLCGVPVVTLLHNITETVDYKSAGITESRLMIFLYNIIGTVLTSLLLMSNMLAVTMPKYVRILEKKYKTGHVALVPHGSFEIPILPHTVPNKTMKIMTFGKFGTYKKVEEMIEAVELVRASTNHDLEIVIAGTDNPNVKGYLKSVKEKYQHVPQMVFTGYVEEEDVASIFLESTVVVFPYTSTTGSSGVLHQAGSYGKAVVLPNIGDLKELIEEEGYKGAYFEPSNVESLANAIEQLVVDPVYRKELEDTNYAAAASLPMSDIADWYLLHFEALTGIDYLGEFDCTNESKVGRKFAGNYMQVETSEDFLFV